MEIYVKKLHPEAKIPCYAHEGDAGMDLFSVEDIDIPAGNHVSCATGVALRIPDGYVGLVWDKSGLSHGHALKMLGGVMDSGYTGEYRIGLINLSREPYHIRKGQKIAQLLIQKVERPGIVPVDDLGATSRGEKGFGSTGLF
jgi:dUTP pyrophosphatase